MALNPTDSAALHYEMVDNSAGPLFAQYGAIRNDAGLDVVQKATALAILINSLETNRSRVRESMTGRDVRAAMDPADWASLTSDKRSAWLSLGGYDDVDPRDGSNDVELAKWIFGTGSQTLAKLAAARNEVISRAAEIGLPNVSPADVQDAGVV